MIICTILVIYKLTELMIRSNLRSGDLGEGTLENIINDNWDHYYHTIKGQMAGSE